MEFYYNYADLEKVELPTVQSAIILQSHKDILGIKAVQDLIACTNAKPMDLVKEVFETVPNITSEESVVAKVRDYIINNGFLYAVGAYDYPPYLRWCKQNNVQEPLDGLIDTFGRCMHITICNLVDAVDLIRKELL